MSDHEVAVICPQWIIKLLSKEGVKQSEYLTELKAQFADTKLSRTPVNDSASMIMENKSHDQRQRWSLKDDNTTAVFYLIEGERQLTVDEIAELSVLDIRGEYKPLEFSYAIIIEHLGCRNDER